MNDLKNLPFDIYTRNTIIQRFVNLIRKKGGLRILDVGGRNGNLDIFLTRDEINTLDILPPDLKQDIYIQGDIRNVPFKNNAFDVVVSSDFFEHIPPEDRKQTLEQMMRVSKNYIILGAPFYSNEVVEAEIKANEYFLNVKGESHPWLKEHIENGLPSSEIFEQILGDFGYDFLVVHSNNLANWLLMQFFIFSAYLHGVPEENLEDIYKYYNTHFLTLGDTLLPTYRRIYLIGKKGTLPNIDFGTYQCSVVDPLHFQELLSRIFNAISGIVQRKDVHIGNLQSIIDSLDLNVQKKQTELSQLESLVKEKDSAIASLNLTLNSIHLSTTWIVLNKFQSCVDALLPHGKMRRSAYDHGIVSLRIILHEGWRTFGFKLKRKISQKLFPAKSVGQIAVSETTIGGLVGNIPRSLQLPLKGSFVSLMNQLNEIKICTATYNRKNSDIFLKLKEDSLQNPEIRTVRLPGSHILDSAYSSFKFPPIANSAGKRYYFEVYSKSSPAAAVWLNPQQTFSQVQLLDEKGMVDGAIGFQCFSKIKIRDPYELWILKNEPDKTTLEVLKKDVSHFSNQPKISILTPVWNTDEKWLRLAIESVINQIYDNWELCLVDGGSTKPHIKRVLNEYAQKDPRVKVKILAENKGIAGNSNEALSLATGEFIGFLDHDDELAPFALREVVALLNQNQNFEFIYSDEDKIDQNGNRKDPFFKPDWSPDLFLSQNYLCHFSIIRKRLIDSVDGFHTGYDGSQDYDLFLRCTEKISPSSIAHIPKILYHWRIIPGSAAGHIVAKPYAITSAKKALEDALLRRGQNGEVVMGIFPSSYRIHYAIQNTPLVSIIIPTKDHVDILKRCVQSILDKTEYQNYEVVIVDNQSSDAETFEYCASLATNPKIKILHYDKSFNFSAINNYAVTQVDSPYILFLNNDMEVISSGWLSAMLEHAQRECVGAVGAKLLYPNNLIQHAGVILGITGTPGQKGVAGHSHKYLPDTFVGHFLRCQIIGNYSAVTAACLMMRKDVFKEIGGFNEDLAIAFNDVDLCLRIRNSGYLIVYTPYSQLYHHESLSRGYEDTPHKQARFSQEVTLIREHWGTVIDKGDPYYNPNLSLESEDFSINSKGCDNE